MAEPRLREDAPLPFSGTATEAWQASSCICPIWRAAVLQRRRSRGDDPDRQRVLRPYSLLHSTRKSMNT